MLKAVVFDFDGVLANTEPLHFIALREVLVTAGIQLSEADYYQRYVGLEDADGLAAIARDRPRAFGQDELQDLLKRKAVATERLMRESSALFPGAADCVHRLSGKVLLGIASGARRREIEIVLDRVGLRQEFSCIVASGDTVRPKPAPDPYQRAVSLLGVPIETAVAVEDSRFGLEAARLAGLKTVAITHSVPADTLASADVIVRHLDDVTLDCLSELTTRRAR